MSFSDYFIAAVVAISVVAIAGAQQGRNDPFLYEFGVPLFLEGDAYSYIGFAGITKGRDLLATTHLPVESVAGEKDNDHHWAKVFIGYLEDVAPFLMAVAALFGVFMPARQYVKTQRSELRWRRFRTTWDFWRDFLSDEEIQEVVQHVETRSAKLEELFVAKSVELSTEQQKLRRIVDRYFEYLEGLVFAVKSGTLLKEDVAVFGWHFDQFVEYKELGNYCRERAYSAVPLFAANFIKREPLFCD